MKKIFIMLCCTLLQLVHIQRINAQTNLIQNGNFENFNLTCCNYTSVKCDKVSNYVSYFNNTTLPAYIVSFNDLCVGSWKCSQGSPDLGVTTCPYPECAGNFATLYGSPESNISEGIFADNLNLSPNSVYTLSFKMSSVVGAYQPYIRLTNDLVHNTNYNNNAMPQVTNSQIIFSTPSVRNLGSWERVSFDFVPKEQYSQLWIYLTSGWINIDDVSLTIKAPYTGPIQSTLNCCNPDVIYDNTVIPIGTSNNVSIIVQNNTTLPNNQNVNLTAGSFIQFSPNLTLTASSSTTLNVSIINCKGKPSINDFGGIGSGPFLTCASGYVGSPIGVPNKLEQGVSYKWSANPSYALNYIENISSPATILWTPGHTSLNVTYTLTASNNCGFSLSDNITINNPCAIRVGNIDADENVTTENNIPTELIYYPNPTNGKFTLKVPESLLNTDFQINDITGKNILKGSTVQLENTIDMTGQPSGVYYIILHNKEEIIREKLIIL